MWIDVLPNDVSAMVSIRTVNHWIANKPHTAQLDLYHYMVKVIYYHTYLY